MNGYWTFYHENGNVKSEGIYENGNGEKIKRELGIPINGTVGKWTFWYENGQKKVEVNLKNGEPDGLVTSWYENGQKELTRMGKKMDYILFGIIMDRRFGKKLSRMGN